MPIQAKADGNVPFIGPRARYNLLAFNSSWWYHQMAPASPMNGLAPASATKDANNLDPTVGGGRAVWPLLVSGGFFISLAKYKKTVIVDAIDNQTNVPGNIVDINNTIIRPIPTIFPFTLCPGETFSFTGGAAGSKVGIMVREEDQELL